MPKQLVVTIIRVFVWCCCYRLNHLQRFGSLVLYIHEKERKSTQAVIKKLSQINSRHPLKREGAAHPKNSFVKKSVLFSPGTVNCRCEEAHPAHIEVVRFAQPAAATAGGLGQQAAPKSGATSSANHTLTHHFRAKPDENRQDSSDRFWSRKTKLFPERSQP